MMERHGFKWAMTLSIALLVATPTHAGSKDGTPEANAKDEAKRQGILSAINDFATYSADVLLDDQGRSRCDYNLIEGKWYPYEIPWHTGQVIYGLVEAYRTTGDEKYLNAAKRAGDWWVSLQITDHPELNGMIYSKHGDAAGDVIVFATTSDGTPGLFRLWETTGEDKYARVPTEAGEWMMTHMYNEEHRLFYDTVDPESGEVMTESNPKSEKWAGVPLEEIDVKMVARPNNEGFLYKDMFIYSGDERYEEMFIELCESLLDYQDEYGLWMDFGPNNKAVGSFHPRFNLWYAESLIEGYTLTNDKRYLEAAVKTLRTYAKAQTKAGTIYYVNYVDGSYDKHSITGSGTAFLGLLALRAVEYGYPEFEETVDRSLDWVLTNRFPSDHSDPNLAGALVNLRSRHKKGKHWITQRDVGTSFGLRFLCDYMQANYGAAETSK